ncbi:5'-nucleotidase [Heterostelium album PN500]|uniref:5'-nucleotidase n=1 Tax=Heterostelium pallidum (strain ATCC 26659 / Pp 5 / PN500) TaxID=670386 RepID=D3B8C8_HETP5|nr:5'-nucleotidase [Heterostelium album PN500]EFA82296.1 5'-nucleotidase [Heterostelium album PN500]|eukprot:XP_020434413.1 5'-nucleotidase [Heterostelium album PN500]
MISLINQSLKSIKKLNVTNLIYLNNSCNNNNNNNNKNRNYCNNNNNKSRNIGEDDIVVESTTTTTTTTIKQNVHLGPSYTYLWNSGQIGSLKNTESFNISPSTSVSTTPNNTQTHHSVLNLSLDQLINMYNNRHFIDLSYVPTLDPQDVFINSELKLSEIQVFGFDYDYTLANYSDQVQHLIYELSINYLVDELKYPTALKDLKYDASFAIRGLHYDMKTGLLMKLDFLNNIQAGAVYYGRRSLSKEDTISVYGSMQLRKQYCENNLKTMSDIFCLPEACLISDITQFLNDNNFSFEPRIIYDDITKAVSKVHLSGSLHNRIINDFPLYLNKHPLLGDFLLKLKSANKKLFLLTNNSFFFANRGMQYLLNDQLGGKYHDWTELFDVIITQCDKPTFFGRGRQFRSFDINSDERYDWSNITEFKPGKVYVGGSLNQFTSISKWKGRSVMYFGDHLFSDLVEPSTREGWRTGVIIKELETEVEIQNSPKYRENLAQLLQIEDTMRKCQFFSGREKDVFLEALKTERYSKRLALKEPFNPNFGSLFRTHTNATMFAYSLHRHADIYTSKIENLISYPLDYVFYPSRNYLPHEFKLN